MKYFLPPPNLIDIFVDNIFGSSSPGEQGDIVLGLPVRLLLSRSSVCAELDLGSDGRFYPSDAALARWRAGTHGQAAVVYE